MIKKLELEAEKYAQNEKFEGFDTQLRRDTFTRYSLNKAYIKGATTSKYVEKQKLEFAIEQLNKLDSVLQSKITKLKNMADESNDFVNAEYFTIKIGGIKLTKEEIRREIKELKQQLKESENT